ncbi:AraC family transcriptional regulator [Clostridium swellfunianum]|uniref:helix-turn-helix domain-containing protein n=1 Tax=Clostridium swellfunianum TaxID=1367462 RepID=UPI00202DEA8A|nr:helix-turn-helix domain-containing protein [Clostridium swellfunianum]MCM0650899.1 AraC family transcriptional regulator [Clostridium swellfunianum]
MKKSIRDIFKFKSLFSRLMLSFLVIIFISSLLHFFSYVLYKNYIKKELINNSNQRVEVLANKLNMSFEQIQNNLLRIYMEDDFKAIANNETLSNYQEKLIIDRLSGYTNFNKNIKNIFIVRENSDLILTSEGSYDRRKFFNTFYNSGIYNEEFWLKESSKNFYNGFYRTVDFIDSSNPNQTTKMFLMPVAFKQVNNSRFIMVALVDIDSIIKANENEFSNDFYIYNKSSEIIYAKSQNRVLDIDIQKLTGVDKQKQGYIFSNKSSIEGITYVKYMPTKDMNSLMLKVNILFVFITISTVLISLSISFIISNRFSKPVTSIIDFIENISEQRSNNNNLEEFQFIRSNIEDIITQNSNYNKEINKKNSMLESLFYFSKIKNIYMNLSEAKDQMIIEQDYILVGFRVHFKKRYYEVVNIEASKITFSIAQLTKGYITDHISNVAVFQSQDDEFILVIQTDKTDSDIKDIISRILSCLGYEDEYIFFTVAISKLCNDVAEFDKCYVSINDIIKYRQPIESNQILEVNKINMQKEEKFHFPLRQIEQLTEALNNCNLEEALKRLSEVLGYNKKGKVNQIYISVIFNEIINRCITAINSVEEATVNINIAQIQNKASKFYSIDQYKKLCEEIINLAIETCKLKENKKDYIVDFILEYIHLHYNEDIYLELFADRLNLTKEYISQYFKNKMGINLVNYLNEFRIEKAKKLLSETSLSINEVAQNVGYNTPNSFSRIFKQYVGKSPREYRQEASI